MAGKKSKISMPQPGRQWAIEAGLRTVTDYNKLMKDKSLLGAVKKAAQEQVKMLGGVVDTKKKK